MMLSELSIRRPVLATVMSLLIILVGFISFERLSVREYPNIDTPVVSVRTVYTGASAEVIESQITQPLEESLAGIEGIKTIKSVSREEVSEITIEFAIERNVDNAANDVRDRVARVRASLPQEANDPVVAKIQADAQAIIWLAFFSNRHSPLEITDYADRFVVPRLQVLEGVASVIIGGERRYAMRIWLDRDRLAAYNLTVQDVEAALRTQNVEIPSGRIESLLREFTVLTATDLRSAEQFNDLIIRQVDGYPIRLRDIGHAQVGAQDERKILRVNREEAVGLGVVKQSTANTLAVAQAVRQEIPFIDLPEGMELRVVFDTSIFIEASIKAVYKTMAEAFLLVVLMIFLFLRSVRVTFIPFVTIPISLIGAFIFLYALDFSINILTLLGLVLAIGIVVDDAIVMLENIHRYIEKGETPIQAALKGSREIGFAVIAMTITLATVFVPLTFMTGSTGRLFGEFALTVSAAVVVSGFVALTLTPMMCSIIFKEHEAHGRFFNVTEAFFQGMNNAYRASLRGILKVRWLVVLIFIGSGYGAVYLYPLIQQELAPSEDRGIFIGFMMAPEGSTLQYTDAYARQVEDIYAKVPEINTSFVIVAPGLQTPNPVNTALSFVSLKPWEERERSQQQISGSIMPEMLGLPGVLAFAINPPSLGQSFRNPPIQFVVQGNSYEELQRMTDKLMGELRNYPGLVNLDSDLKLNKPQLLVRIDRDKAAALGVDIATVGRTLETLLGGRQVTRFKHEGQQYDVIVQLQPLERTRPDDLTAIFVRNQQGEQIQLSNLVTFEETVAPKELNRFNRLRSVLISANLGQGYSLGEVLQHIQTVADQVLDDTAKTALDGQSREFVESGETLMVTFILALVFIYLVLAAQFESFVSPFTIMLTVPLAMTGALWALYLTQGTLNVYSQIGLVMLIGLITRHGILIVEFANQLQLKGEEIYAAVIEASVLRLRPILMTSLSMILGTIPLALATGAGSESRQQIGWVIIGGLGLGTLLTLFIIPVAYTLLTPRLKARL
ncbi:efflux RND transporter permease subunit [Thioflexithrix psekupsensis]|uniref:Multidrug transporter AcrB n=1 Tax=Thioflexithrix psekupsensis TaxID=1570016 RepID=A0A251X528_9GAMM|nr:efflux RND transporter permease subunit [Thioflexithrix psekupsensis]OUD12531.1 multidrug transporter AcrB [Thioflexithrix psekupsensis]